MKRKRASENSFIPIAMVLLIWTALALGSCSASQEISATLTPPRQETNVASTLWKPEPLSTFQIQFSGELDLTVDAAIFELDGFDTEAAIVEQLHSAGKKVICYIDAGTIEDWRPDAGQYPENVIGKIDTGWPGENWLDIRAVDTLAPLLESRIKMCQSKGFDGVDFDNVDGYQNETGFDLNAEDQLTFNRWLAETAHRYGLAVALKNDPDQIAELEPWFDFAVLESCFAGGWCDQVQPFVKSGKAVIDLEYSSITPYCKMARQNGITLVGKNINLNASLETCPNS